MTTALDAADPIPAGADAYTMHDYRAARLAFERATSVDIYEQCMGCRKQPWDDRAIEFLTHWATRRVGLPDRPPRDEILAIGEAVIEAGCDDPMVLLAYGELLNSKNFQREAGDALAKALETMSDGPYPHFRRAQAAAAYAAYLPAWHRDDETEQVFVQCRDAVLASLATDAFPPEHHRFISRWLGDLVADHDLPSLHAKRIVEALAENPEALGTWGRDYVTGRYHIRAAWDARGSGWASTVTEEGWAVFHEELGHAATCLQRAHATDPSLPDAAEEMIIVVKGGCDTPGGDERYWFDQAVKAQLDWPDAYSGLIDALLPRWGGSHEAMYEFGLECAATGRYDTSVPYQLIYVLRRMGDDGYSAFDLWQRPGVYETVIATAEELRAHTDDPVTQHWYQSMKIAFAWVNDRWEDCRGWLDETSGPLDEKAIKSFLTTERQIRDDAYLHTSPLRDAVLAADEAIYEGLLDDAIAAYEQARLDAVDDNVMLAIIEDRLYCVRFYQAYHTGEWVDLRFEPGLPGWRAHRGAWQGLGDAGVRGGLDERGMLLACVVPVGPRFELTGTIHTYHLGSRPFQGPNAGVVFRLNDDPSDFCWQSFTVHPRTKELKIRPWFNDDDSVSVKYEAERMAREVQFHLKLWDNRCVILINGEEAYAREVPVTPNYDLGYGFGLGSHGRNCAGFARYEGLRIRVLTERPEELSSQRTSDAGQN